MLSKNQIKEIQSLQIKKFRDQKRFFIVEGVKNVLELLQDRPEMIEQIVGTHDFIEINQAQLTKFGVLFHSIDEDTLRKISLQNNPNQVMAICRYFDGTVTIPDFENNFTFYLDDIRDPGNFGTIIRLANWFGMETVYCSESSCDFYNPKVIQSTMGAFLRVRVEYCKLSELIKTNAIKHVYGALLNGENIYQQSLKGGLVVIGNEAKGITENNLKLITKPITIPSAKNNGTESLNAAMAASVLASEFYRQLSARL